MAEIASAIYLDLPASTVIKIGYNLCALSLSLLSLPLDAGERVEKEVVLRKIEEFSNLKDAYPLVAALKLLRTHSVVGAESPAVAVELYCSLLVEADRFLLENPKPEKRPVLNVSPPGDEGMPGVDPAFISDPKDRALYEKMIAANAKLARERSRHTTVSSVMASALRTLAGYRLNGLATEERIGEAIERKSANQNQKLALRREVDGATAKRAKPAAGRADQPETP